MEHGCGGGASRASTSVKAGDAGMVWRSEVSYDAAECLQRNHGVTGILRGEGEESFHELMQYYIGGSGKLQGYPWDYLPGRRTVGG